MRFLWFGGDITEENATIAVFRFLRAVFGVNSSPFLLNGTIRHHLDKYILSDREFVEKFIEDLYVDDTTSGCDTVEEGKKFYTRAKEIMSKAGFELRKWVTNNSDLRNFISENEQSVVENTFSNHHHLLRPVAFLKSPLNHGCSQRRQDKQFQPLSRTVWLVFLVSAMWLSYL